MYRRIAPLVALVALAGTACSEESNAVRVDADATPLELLRAAPEAAAAAGTSQFEMVIEIDTAEMPGPLEMTGSGAADYAAGRMEMSLDMGSMFETLAETAGESMPDGFDGPWQIVIDGTDFYMQAPMFEVLGGPSGWLHVSTEDLGVDLEELGLAGPTQDPTQSLEWLRGASDSVEELGTDTIRGVETTRYAATLDLAKAMEQLPDAQREALDDLMGDLPADFEGLPVEIWVDADGLPRRMQMTLDAASMGAAGMDGTVTMTIDFFAFGEPVDIEVPSPDEVTELSDAFGGLGEEFVPTGDTIPEPSS